MNEKLVRDLSHEAHFRMQMLLLPPNPGRDWKTLADKMGFPREEILYFECRKEPVLELISSYESKGKTVSELLSLLEEMERFDVIEDLRKFIGKPLVCELSFVSYNATIVPWPFDYDISFILTPS